MSDKLYNLLPSLYRQRDAVIGNPLQALMAVFEGQLSTLQRDIGDLYDNWFIETCDEWVVPYIGDLLSVRSQYIFDDKASLRSFVANTLRYRQSKGTAAMLEGMARDVTGWQAVTVEFFKLLGTTQNLNHIRSADLRTPDLRDTNALELLGGPFECAMRFAEVRRISTMGGKYNIGNVGIFLWRLQSLKIDRAPAVKSVADGDGRWLFSQLACDSRLYNREADEVQGVRVTEADVPGPLRARALYDELNNARDSLQNGETPTYAYLGGTPAFQIFADGQPVAPELIQICNLKEWTSPNPLPPAVSFTEPQDPPAQPKQLSTLIAVDPTLGRLAYLDGTALPSTVHVSYYSAFSAGIGGGSYPRQASTVTPTAPTLYDVNVGDPTKSADDAFLTALTNWENAQKPSAIFTFRGPALFKNPLTNLNEGSGIFSVRDFAIPKGCTVQLTAPDGYQPMLRLTAPWQVTVAETGCLSLNGLLIAGDELRIVTTTSAGDTDQLAHQVTIEDTTLVPGQRLDPSGAAMVPNGISLTTDAASTGELSITILRSILGCVDLTPGAAGFAPSLTVQDAILDGTNDGVGTAPPVLKTLGYANLTHVTLLGASACGWLDASECIFDQPVTATRTQIGCVRFSYVPTGSITPKAYRCQPAFALAQPGANATQISAALKPVYTQRRYGDPAYAQLANTCPTEIARGAEAELEMGAFWLVKQTERLANLQTSLDEYLRFGLEAGVFLVT
jgi:hypothetical protein